jgi:hypothetical protein
VCTLRGVGLVLACDLCWVLGGVRETPVSYWKSAPTRLNQRPTRARSHLFGGEADIIGKDMKDAFQQQHESEENDEMMIGPKGTPVLTPEAAQRKAARDRAASEEVRWSLCCLPCVVQVA